MIGCTNNNLKGTLMKSISSFIKTRKKIEMFEDNWYILSMIK